MSFFLSRDSYPMLLVANKVDLVHLRKVSEEQGKELAVNLKVSFSANVILTMVCKIFFTASFIYNLQI